MALDFTALQAEIAARGFAYLADGGTGQTRLKRWVNSAMHDLDDAERWPYLAASVSGAAPLTIADLDGVQAVTANSVPLASADREFLLNTYGELVTTGTPVYYYFATPTVVSVYPVSTGSITVTYWKVGPDLSAGGDAPLMPDRYRDAIVERACAYAYRDNDDPQMSAVCMAESDRIVQRMRESYAQLPGGTRQVIYGHSQDW